MKSVRFFLVVLSFFIGGYAKYIDIQDIPIQNVEIDTSSSSIIQTFTIFLKIDWLNFSHSANISTSNNNLLHVPYPLISKSDSTCAIKFNSRYDYCLNNLNNTDSVTIYARNSDILLDSTIVYITYSKKEKPFKFKVIDHKFNRPVSEVVPRENGFDCFGQYLLINDNEFLLENPDKTTTRYIGTDSKNNTYFYSSHNLMSSFYKYDGNDTTMIFKHPERSNITIDAELDNGNIFFSNYIKYDGTFTSTIDNVKNNSIIHANDNDNEVWYGSHNIDLYDNISSNNKLIRYVQGEYTNYDITPTKSPSLRYITDIDIYKNDSSYHFVSETPIMYRMNKDSIYLENSSCYWGYHKVNDSSYYFADDYITAYFDGHDTTVVYDKSASGLYYNEDEDTYYYSSFVGITNNKFYVGKMQNNEFGNEIEFNYEKNDVRIQYIWTQVISAYNDQYILKFSERREFNNDIHVDVEYGVFKNGQLTMFEEGLNLIANEDGIVVFTKKDDSDRFIYDIKHGNEIEFHNDFSLKYYYNNPSPLVFHKNIYSDLIYIDNGTLVYFDRANGEYICYHNILQNSNAKISHAVMSKDKKTMYLSNNTSTVKELKFGSIDSVSIIYDNNPIQTPRASEISYSNGFLSLNGIDRANVVIYSLNGRVIKEFSSTGGMINVENNLSNGLYILNIKGLNSNLIQKIMIGN